MTGCGFRHRCPLSPDRCNIEVPELVQVDDGSAVACHSYRANEVGVG